MDTLKSMLKINWLGLEKPNPFHLLDMEYHLQLQVIMVLIKEAEHLMDYLSLVIIDIDPKEGSLQINMDTPEPLRTILRKGLTDSHLPMMKNKPLNSQRLSLGVTSKLKQKA